MTQAPRDAGAARDAAWEAAYLRFETPKAEEGKFRQRLCALGVDRWPHDSQVVELFCGRGSGLHALHGLGFRRVEGVDRSPRLAGAYVGPGRIHVADCRALPFPDASRDVAVVRGGLHHLERLPEDLRAVLGEIRRVLRPDGRLVLVEPWMTPFLSLVHRCCEARVLRAVWRRLDALAEMIVHERATYEAWLSQPESILADIDEGFETVRRRIAWGKLWLVARVRRTASGREPPIMASRREI